MTDDKSSCGLCGHEKTEVVYRTAVRRASGETRRLMVCVECDFCGSEPCPGRR